MGKEINWERVALWDEGDDFLAFAFGDFDSKSAKIVRVSNGNRYSTQLSAPMQDITAEVPGGDGQYYFGTFYRPKQFEVSFAFDNLTKGDIRNLKKAFDGRELKELCFSEERDRVYMAKVTGQPNIKSLCFDIDGEEIYKGEGSVSFTAYWPYARERNIVKQDLQSNEIVNNEGNIPTYFTLTANKASEILEIEIYDGESDEAVLLNKIETEKPITEWNTKTGIVKSEDKPIGYTGTSLFLLPTGRSKVSITSSKETSDSNEVTISYYNWYY